MKIKVNTERQGLKELVMGWHISKHVGGPVEEIGTDHGNGYLLVTASKTASLSAFGKTWDVANGFTKKMWLTAASARGLDNTPGLILTDSGSTNIQVTTSINNGVSPREARFDIKVSPDGPGMGRLFHHSSLYFEGNYKLYPTLVEQDVLSHSMTLRNEFGNPKLAAQEIMGLVEFTDVTFEIDATHIFPTDPLDGEKGWVYTDAVDLPVNTLVFARNFHNFEIITGAILQIPSTTLDGRRIEVANVDNTKPLTLPRANTVQIFRNL